MFRHTLIAAAAVLLLVPGASATDAPDKAHRLKLRGTIVELTAESVSVRNLLGDLTMTCTLDEPLAGLAEGDRVVVKCERRGGRPAAFLRAERLDRKQEKEKEKERREGAVADIAGEVVEASAESLTVENAERSLTCSVPDAYAEKVARLEPGTKVKMVCKDGKLAALGLAVETKPAEQKLYGRIVALSARAVTVEGESGRLTCEVPDWSAEKVGRFAVGDSVKMLCRDGELTYLERV